MKIMNCESESESESEKIHMASKIILDLRGVISPLNLLKCKNTLKAMEQGEIMEVILADADVIQDLLMIVERSTDKVVYQNKKADYICLGIKKGNRIQNS